MARQLLEQRRKVTFMPTDWTAPLASWLPFIVLILVWLALSQTMDGSKPTPPGFRRVDGGYLFQPVIGWGLGRSPCYFVNDAQRDAISARLRQNQEVMRRARIAFVVAVLGITASLLLTRVELPNAVLIASVVTCTAFLIAMHVYAQRTISPMLKGLPIVQQGVSLAGQFEPHSKALWARVHLLFGLLCVLGALLFATQTDWPFVATFWMLVAAHQFWLAFVSGRR
jgi:hypothetical protein